MVAILGGVPVILGCVVFLYFLWLGDVRNWVWRRIVAAEWVSRSVTITALLLRWVLRWATAAQAVAATSMTASLLLQTAETPLASAAAVSLAVYSNQGLHTLLPWLPCGLGFRRASFGFLVVLLTSTTTLL